MKIGVLLSGCGVYDGAEIQESVFALLAIDQLGHEAVCIGIDKNQYHVVNHLTGQEVDEKRNMMVEAARIARGNITNISDISPSKIDALVIPGGFGSAKNFTTWAFEGPNSQILPEVKLLLVNLLNVGKPIVALCVSPVVVAKAFEDINLEGTLTLGSTKEASPYNIAEFHEGIQSRGFQFEEKTLTEISIDSKNRIISAPCYMMDGSVSSIYKNVYQAIAAIEELN